MRKRRTAAVIGALVVTISTVLLVTNAAAVPNVQDYAVGISEGYETEALLSVGGTVPETSDPSKDYKMVGIPDGLGAHKAPHGKRIVYMNHELTNSTNSEPVVGDPLNRGAFVSKLVLDRDGDVISGERAYDWVYNENTFVGPAAQVGNSTRPFSRFCSGSLATPQEHGFDRHIYLTNEEEGTPANTFDTMGGLAVAIVDNKLFTLPKLGRFAWENTLVQPTHGNKTVIMGMEDGPSVLDPAQENSQVYMYVGHKERRHGATVLRRNGLDNGQLYVLVPESSSQGSEADVLSGTIDVEWELIPNAGALSEAQLEAASDAAGAFRFARPEDGAFNNRNRNEFFFVTTGGSVPAGANSLGRLYSLKLDRRDPTDDGELTVLYNADTVIGTGSDIAISPDNVDVSDDYLMVQEDGTAESRPVMAAKGRDGSIWRFDIDRDGVDVSTAERVVELDPPGRDGIPVGAGIWETSGIIDGEELFGNGTWLFDVQAHPPTTPPAPNTVEDGQLLLLTQDD
jgi:secreted PhoX family phosphatase